MAVVLRQALIYSIRKGGKDTLIHPHEQITLFPLLWTCVACFAAMVNYIPSLGPGLSEAHLGLVFTPQVLTWYWSMQNRGELSKSDFTAHALAFAAIMVLLLTGGHIGSIISVFVSLIALGKQSGFPKSRQSFLWCIALVVSAQRALAVPFAINSWVLSFCEVAMMFLVKFRVPLLFNFDKRLDDRYIMGSDFSSPPSESSLEAQSRSPMVKGGPLVVFDSASELGSLPTPPLPPLSRTDSTGSGRYLHPLDLLRKDSGGLPRPPGSGHRRGVSTQSSGGSWAWGVAVQDFGRSISPMLSSDEEDGF